MLTLKKEKNAAIILAGGKGKRMHTKVPKQYLKLGEYPVLYYTIKAFEESFIDDIILVVGKEEIAYCQKEIVEKYNFHKIKKIVVGGKERYHSVYEGLKMVERDTKNVYIHDGARPFIDQDVLNRVRKQMEQVEACVVGMPVKDTIKVVNQESVVEKTPDRSLLWQIQTPQVFSYKLIIKAYERLMISDQKGITDDAMVVETLTDTPIKLVKGSYKNIKITTPEDLKVGQVFVENL